MILCIHYYLQSDLQGWSSSILPNRKFAEFDLFDLSPQKNSHGMRLTTYSYPFILYLQFDSSNFSQRLCSHLPNREVAAFVDLNTLSFKLVIDLDKKYYRSFDSTSLTNLYSFQQIPKVDSASSSVLKAVH